MAKASWLTVKSGTSEVANGSGDATLSLSATANKGRNERTTTLTITGTSLTAKTYTVKQSGSAIYANGNDNNVANTGSSALSVKFTTNGKCFKIIKQTVNASGAKTDGAAYTGSGTYNIDGFFYADNKYSATYKSENATQASINTVQAPEGQTSATWANSVCSPKDDPGATGEYTGLIAIKIPANTGTAPIKYFLKIVAYTTDTSSTSASKELVITVANGNAFLKVLNDSNVEYTNGATLFTLVAAGTAKTIKIDSNTSWTIS